MKRLSPLFITLSLLFAAGACGSDSGTGPVDPTDLEFAPSLNVVLDDMTKTSSGLYYQDLVVGTGAEAGPGDVVTVHYTGWLHDGTEFDSSIGGDPLTIDLDGVIQGWKERHGPR